MRYKAVFTLVLIFFISVVHAQPDRSAVQDNRKEQIFLKYPHIPNYHMEQNHTFSESVQEAWVSHFASGLAPSIDVVTDMALDNSGNSYVTGYSSKFPYGVDYFTVKYNNAGAEQWRIRYDNGYDDIATAIVIDGSGNIYNRI